MQADVAAVSVSIRDWTIAQIPWGAGNLNRWYCNGTILRGLIEPTAGGGLALTARVLLHSLALGLAIRQACYATSDNYESAVLKLLPKQRTYFDSSTSGKPFSSCTS